MDLQGVIPNDRNNVVITLDKFTPIFGVSNRAQMTSTHTNVDHLDHGITRLLQENERMQFENNHPLAAVGIGSQTESQLDHLVMLVQLGNSIQNYLVRSSGWMLMGPCS